MKNKSDQIIFFGSGPVASASLKNLAEVFKIEAVITKKNTLEEMAKSAPLAKSFTADTKTELDLIFTQNKFTSQIGVLVDYGVILSKKVIDYFPLGIVNSHFSLLPKLRGADPITFFILSGDKTTGVSLMLIVEAMDEGPLLAQFSISPPDNIATPELTKNLIDLSNKKLKEILPAYINGKVELVEQNSNIKPTYSQKLTKKDGKIDWNKPAKQIEREIRAFIDWPKSYTKLGSVDLIVKKVEIVDRQGQPGEIFSTSSELIVFCGDKALKLLSVQPFGKKEMPVKAFLAGYRNAL